MGVWYVYPKWSTASHISFTRSVSNASQHTIVPASKGIDEFLQTGAKPAPDITASRRLHCVAVTIAIYLQTVCTYHHRGRWLSCWKTTYPTMKWFRSLRSGVGDGVSGKKQSHCLDGCIGESMRRDTPIKNYPTEETVFKKKGWIHIYAYLLIERNHPKRIPINSKCVQRYQRKNRRGEQ